MELLEVDGVLESSALVRKAASTGSMVRTDAVLDHLTDLVAASTRSTWFDTVWSSGLEDDRASFVMGTKEDGILGSGAVAARESLVLGIGAAVAGVTSVEGCDRARSFCACSFCCCSDDRRSSRRLVFVPVELPPPLYVVW